MGNLRMFGGVEKNAESESLMNFLSNDIIKTIKMGLSCSQAGLYLGTAQCINLEADT